MHSTHLDRIAACSLSEQTRRVCQRPGLLIRLLVGAVVMLGTGSGCDGAAGAKPPLTRLPAALDLRIESEGSQWRAGPAIRSLSTSSAGLSVETAPGATAGRWIERTLRVGSDRLGAIELRTAAAPGESTDIEIVPIVEGRLRTRQSVRARAAETDPTTLLARFRTGAWNVAELDGVRLVFGDGTDRITLAHVRVTTERYAPLPPAPVRRVVEASPDRPHVVLLVADTLRADRMSLYGAARPTTPVLDALATGGTVFDHAWSQAACTFPSVNALLTGQPTGAFLGEPARERRSLSNRGALAQRLHHAGYATAAVSASWIVRATPSVHNDWGGGYDAGFTRFDETCAGEAAACVSRRALEWIDGRGSGARPFFLYLHYLDPHDPYRPPPDHVRRFAPEDFPDARIRAGDPNGLADAPERATERAMQHLLDLYDEEIAYLDRQIGHLFDALESRGLLANTIVVLASDHGEAFGEHGDWKHCSSVYEEQTRTPLVFWGPGVPRGIRSPAPAESVDILPTLLDLTGIGTTPQDAQAGLIGESLRPGMTSDTRSTTLAHSSQGPWQGVTDGRHKWIEHVARESGSLYDLAQDPGERAPLPFAHDRTLRIRDMLSDAMARRGEGAHARARAWGNIERQLRALGYLE